MAIYVIKAVDGDKEEAVIIVKDSHIRAAAEAARNYTERFFKTADGVRAKSYGAETTSEKFVFTIEAEFEGGYRHERRVRVKRAKGFSAAIDRIYVTKG
jgi:hypothetical protein